MYTPKQVAKNLREIIFKQYESLKEFSHELGISPSNLSNILSGKGYLSAKNALKFSSLLGLNPRFLAFGDDPVYIVDDEDNTNYIYGLKPKVLSSLDLSDDELELVNLIGHNFNPNAFYPRIQLSFVNNKDGRFERMINASKQLASRLVDKSVLEHLSLQELYSTDHGDKIPIYTEYEHIINNLMIKSNFRHTYGYIELFINIEFFCVVGW